MTVTFSLLHPVLNGDIEPAWALRCPVARGVAMGGLAPVPPRSALQGWTMELGWRR